MFKRIVVISMAVFFLTGAMAFPAFSMMPQTAVCNAAPAAAKVTDEEMAAIQTIFYATWKSNEDGTDYQMSPQEEQIKEVYNFDAATGTAFFRIGKEGVAQDFYVEIKDASDMKWFSDSNATKAFSSFKRAEENSGQEQGNAAQHDNAQGDAEQHGDVAQHDNGAEHGHDGGETAEDTAE